MEDIIGFIAGILTSVCTIPQIQKIIKEKSADDVSYGMYALLTVGVSMWVVFGIMKSEISIIITNGVSIFLNLAIIALKFKYRDGK